MEKSLKELSEKFAVNILSTEQAANIKGGSGLDVEAESEVAIEELEIATSYNNSWPLAKFY